MIQKHELPILEYDSSSEEVIKPNLGTQQLKLPEKCIYAFLGHTVDDYALQANAAVAETFETITRDYPVYIIHQDGNLSLCRPFGRACGSTVDGLSHRLRLQKNHFDRFLRRLG